MATDDSSPCGKLIKLYRKSSRLTQEELAGRSGVSVRAIQSLENGSTQKPHKDTLERLANALALDKEERARLEEARRGRMVPVRFNQSPSTLPPYAPSSKTLANTSLASAPSPTVTSAESRSHGAADSPGAIRQSPISGGSGQIPLPGPLWGRKRELDQIQRWILSEHRSVVALVGMGGIGKTALAAAVALRMQERFECLVWCSLRDAPPIEDLLTECLRQLTDLEQAASLPQAEDEQIAELLERLAARRTLLVLDNFDVVFERDGSAGQYQATYSGFRRLLKHLIEVGVAHKSTLVLTSRQVPNELAHTYTETRTATGVLRLGGLPTRGARQLLQDNRLQGSTEQQQDLIRHYQGNPLALNVLAGAIRDIFAGDIGDFLNSRRPATGDIRQILDEQIDQLPALERALLFWLAIERVPVSPGELYADLLPRIATGEIDGDVISALQSLLRRTLVEAPAPSRFTLQPFVMEHLTERLISAMCSEIASGGYRLFARFAVLKAQAAEPIKESQMRLILGPLSGRLVAALGQTRLTQQLLDLLTALRQSDRKRDVALQAGYTAGNALNLLIYLRHNLRGADLSQLVIRHAYFRDVDIPEADLSGSDLTTSVFAQVFGGVLALAYHPQSDLVAAGTMNGEVYTWLAGRGTPWRVYQGHQGWVGCVAFSPDGKLLASGSDDYTVRLWDIESGDLVAVLREHTSYVRGLAFSPDGKILASVSDDCTIRLWDPESGDLRQVLAVGDRERVRSIAFSPDGTFLATGSSEGTVRIWDAHRGTCQRTLHGHEGWVRSLTFNSEGDLLASGSADTTIRLWKISDGQCWQVLTGHDGPIWSVAFNPDGKVLVSGGEDRTVRLWDAESGAAYDTLFGHTNRVRAVVFSADGELLASGGDDQTVRLWGAQNGQALMSWQGHSMGIWSVAFSPDGRLLASAQEDRTVRLRMAPDVGSTNHEDTNGEERLPTLRGHRSRIASVAFSPDGWLLASGSEDRTIRVYTTRAGAVQTVLRGHRDGVRSVAFRPDGLLLASGSDDRTVRLWRVNTWESLPPLQGHTGGVRAISFVPDGRFLASGSDDCTIRVWDIDNGECVLQLEGHQDRVRAVAVSPDGQLLASGGADRVVRMWRLREGACEQKLGGHTDWIRTVIYAPDGSILASGGDDRTVRIWSVADGHVIMVLRGHTDRVWSLTFTPDGRLLASASEDGTIRLWHTDSWTSHAILRADRPYERLNISGVIGLTHAQCAALQALGAIGDCDVSQRLPS